MAQDDDTEQPARYPAGMMAWRLAAALVAAVVQAGCTDVPAADQLFSSSELSGLVTDRTLYVAPYGDTPQGMLLYLARGGTGWLDSRLAPAYIPTPGGMSIVFDWHVMDGSRVCLWATPLIGDVPSLAPAFFECLQVLRSREPLGGLTATITRDDESRTGWLYLYSFNAFPNAVIERYLSQARVLYGGGIPEWTVPKLVQTLN